MWHLSYPLPTSPVWHDKGFYEPLLVKLPVKKTLPSSNLCKQWIMFIKFIWATDIVLLFFLSRRTFDTGWSGSMETDKIPQRQSGLHRQHGPHQKRLFLSVRCVDRRRCPKPHQKQILNIILDGPPACFKNIYIVCCKRVKSTDVSHKQTPPKKNVISVRPTCRTKGQPKGCKRYLCIPETKREKVDQICL